MRTFTFPTGYHAFHPVAILNYQLNRWHSLGYTRLDDMAAAAAEIRRLDDWKPAFMRQAESALSDGRTLQAAFHVRAAEFFTSPSDPDKLVLYEQFVRLFDEATAEDGYERVQVPFEDGWLPAIRVQPVGERHGTLVVHGGFDSFMEEFYSLACYFASRGQEVILFEGPGQGAALKREGLSLTHEWERPARAVLDHFGRHGVTWLGISMGGWLCFRAAAFEPRIARVIASSVVFDYMQILPPPAAALARWLMGHPRLFDAIARRKAKVSAQNRWGIENMLHITREATPLAATKVMLGFNEAHMHADRVTQDVLILTGAEDHFIPLKMHHKQIKALTHAHSVTGRIFTREEQAQNHCQVGNFGLALETMADWLQPHAGPPG